MNNPLSSLPLGFGMALAQNMDAMQRFSAMSDAQKQDVITRTHSISSKGEMRAFVNSLSRPQQ